MRGVVSLGIVLALLAGASVECHGQTAADLRQKAVAFEQAGNNAEAVAAWQALLKVQPANAEAYAHLGFLEAQQEHYREAVPLYKKALTLSPSMPSLKMNLGLALFKAGEFKASYSDIRAYFEESASKLSGGTTTENAYGLGLLRAAGLLCRSPVSQRSYNQRPAKPSIPALPRA